MSMMFDQSYSYVDKLANLIKHKSPDIPVILGGASHQQLGAKLLRNKKI